MAPYDVRLVKDEWADEDVTTVVQPDVCVICDPKKNGGPEKLPWCTGYRCRSFIAGEQQERNQNKIRSVRGVWCKGVLVSISGRAIADKIYP